MVDQFSLLWDSLSLTQIHCCNQRHTDKSQTETDWTKGKYTTYILGIYVIYIHITTNQRNPLRSLEWSSKTLHSFLSNTNAKGHYVSNFIAGTRDASSFWCETIRCLSFDRTESKFGTFFTLHRNQTKIIDIIAIIYINPTLEETWLFPSKTNDRKYSY